MFNFVIGWLNNAILTLAAKPRARLVVLGWLALVVTVALGAWAWLVVSAPPEIALCGTGTLTRDGLVIEKNIRCEMARTWEWSLEKSADQPRLTLGGGQQHIVNYTIRAAAYPAGSFQIYGQITVSNQSGAPVSLTAIIDDLSPVVCDVSFPHKMKPDEVVTCEYDRTLPFQPGQNIVEVVRESGKAYQLAVSVAWPAVSSGDVDECIAFDAILEPVCVGDQRNFSFAFSETVGPYTACGAYLVDTPTAFRANDTGATGSAQAGVQVLVPCEGGCTLPAAYWLTHSAYGPDALDPVWEARQSGDASFFGTGKTYYQILAMSSTENNPFTSLAQAYITADLNSLNQAIMPGKIASAFSQAASLLIQYENKHIISDPVDQSLAVFLTASLTEYNTGLTGPAPCTR